MASGKRRNSGILWSIVGIALSTVLVLLVLSPALVSGNSNVHEHSHSHPQPEAQDRSSVVFQQSLKHAASRGPMPLQATVVEVEYGNDVEDSAEKHERVVRESLTSTQLLHFDRRLLLGRVKDADDEAEKEKAEKEEVKKSMEVDMVHYAHPNSPVPKKMLTQVEHVMDRIGGDQHRVNQLKKQLHSRISRNVRGLNEADITGNYDFLTPVISGSTLGSGQYFVDFYLGTPPQKFSLIADTGSDLIWVQCPPCVSCYSQIGPIFQPKDSSTYSPLSCVSDECQFVPAPLNFTCSHSAPVDCAYAYVYTDQSVTEGVFSTDTATMNVSKDGKNVRINNVAFGCGNFNMGPSLTGAGGVIGLGQGPTSFTSQIGAYFGNKFSYCLVNYLDAPTVSSTLIFGDSVKRSKEEVQYTPFVPNPNAPTFYYLGIRSVSVAGTELGIHPQVWEITQLGDGGTIIDSGVTLTVFLEPAYLVILNAFQNHICQTYTRVPSVQGLDLCFSTANYAQNPFSELPSFSVKFQNGAFFSPPPENIYVLVADNTMCLAMQGSSSPFGFNILGNLIQQNFDVVYDRQKQRLGFAPAKC